MSKLDYAQAFFGSNGKGKSRDFGSEARKNYHVRVRQVILSDELRPGLLKIEPKRSVEKAAFIADSLRNELNFETVSDPTVTIKTLSDQTSITKAGQNHFCSLESLSTGEEFSFKNVLVVPNFNDDESVFPHSVDIEGLDNSNNVEIPTVSGRKSIDVLIGQANKNLLTVLHENENVDPDKSNHVLTKLGPIASGGRVPAVFNTCASLKVNLNADCECSGRCCAKFKNEIADLKQSLRELDLADEAVEPSRNDEIAKQLVETMLK